MRTSELKQTILGFILVAIALFLGFMCLESANNWNEIAKESNYTNRSDYVDSCYLLTPKKKAYFYKGENSASKFKEVSNIVIPANAAISTTVHSNAYFSFLLSTPNTHADDPFLTAFGENNNHVDFPNNLTLNPNYTYPLNENAKFIKVVALRKLYRYKGLGFAKYTFLAPVKGNMVKNDVEFSKQPTYYINLSEFKLNYKEKYNISKTKAQICLGFITR